MYMAASTIATAPTTAQPHPIAKMPLSTRNSAANALEPGTASAITPVVIRSVARTGRPRGHAAEQDELAGRRAPLDRPARRKSAAEISPWLIICRTAPAQSRVVCGEEARSR